VHAVRWAPARPAGVPVLLLHGLGASTIQWELVGAPLARRLAAPVLAVDLAGFGLTRATPEAAGILPNAELVIRLLGELGPARLVGNSMGGAVAIAVAARRPDLVARLVLVTPTLPQPSPPGPPEPFIPRNLPAALPVLGPLLVAAYAHSLPAAAIIDERLAAAFHDRRRIDPGIRRRLIDLVRLRRRFPEGPAAYAAAARTLLAYLTLPGGIARDMQRVAAPTQIVHGAQDELVPVALAHDALRRRRDWRLDVIDPCGHLPQLEHPDRLVEAVMLGEAG